MKNIRNIKIEAGLGDMFQKVAQKAKDAAITVQNRNCQFNFNGIECIVGPDTDLDNLYKYYTDAHTMEWKEVGPVCENEYSPEVQQELNKRRQKQEEEMEAQRAIWKKEQEEKTAKVTETTKGLQIELKDAALWEDQKKVNADGGYGQAIMEFAERWALLMQAKIDTTKDIQFQVAALADKASHEADTEGITGFMYGAAVQELSACWKYGEELRKWHNKEYGHEGKGVVNPAVLTISTK